MFLYDLDALLLMFTTFFCVIPDMSQFAVLNKNRVVEFSFTIPIFYFEHWKTHRLGRSDILMFFGFWFYSGIVQSSNLSQPTTYDIHNGRLAH